MKKTAVKAAALMVAVLSALTLVFGTATRASAVSVLDQLIEEIKEAKREIKNVSSLSAQKLMLGETLTMYGKVEGIEPEKCEFGFYVRLNGLFWMTAQSYSSDSVCEWTPTAQGDYEVCIKVKYKTKIEKQYFNIRVSEPLYNHSYVSTSFLQQGETIELTGNAEGGFGDVQYGFYYQENGSDSWTTLSDFSEANHITWKPQHTGDFELCIKVKDEDDQYDTKTFDLTVSPVLTKTPVSFTVTVKSPISSPYFWKCSVEDKGIVGVEVTESAPQIDELRAYVLREYRFTTIAAGRTNIKLSYDAHNGTEYVLNYDITVDKGLNVTINHTDGTYFERTLPKAEQIKGGFALKVEDDKSAGRWKCQISDNQVLEETAADMQEDGYSVFQFHTLREGYVTLTLSCSSVTSMTDSYKLIYNLYVDKDLNVKMRDCDGYYIEDRELPGLITE